MSTGTQPVSARGATNGAAGELREWRDHARVFLQPIAAPSILGLYGFAAATFMVTAHQVGWYGNERGERYEVSIKAGERLLLPRIRAASPHTLILTDGFSCRSQIEHGSERSGLHLVQVVQMALRDGPTGPSTAPPEHRYSLAARNQG